MLWRNSKNMGDPTSALPRALLPTPTATDDSSSTSGSRARDKDLLQSRHSLLKRSNITAVACVPCQRKKSKVSLCVTLSQSNACTDACLGSASRTDTGASTKHFKRPQTLSGNAGVSYASSPTAHENVSNSELTASCTVRWQPSCMLLLHCEEAGGLLF